MACFVTGAPFLYFRYGFLRDQFNKFFVVMAAEGGNVVGEHGHIHFGGNRAPKIVDVWQEEKRKDRLTLGEARDAAALVSLYRC